MQMLSDLFQQPRNVHQFLINTTMEWTLESPTLWDNPPCVHYILSHMIHLSLSYKERDDSQFLTKSAKFLSA